MSYPTQPAARTRWILERRGPRPTHDVWRAHGSFVEPERDASGEVVPVLTVLLTSRECPWRCVMCDLWKFTVESEIPHGAIPAQIEGVLSGLDARGGTAPVRHLKLYNGGSFFDRRAVPREDHPRIARLAAGFEHLVVECHPALVGESVFRFRDTLGEGGVTLEVAMGLETAHPAVLRKLNKGMTLELFQRAVARLRNHQIAVRAFVLVKPPFLAESDALEWADRSVQFAFACGVGVVVLIPTRGGNGAMEELARDGCYAPPACTTFEAALEAGISLRQGRVFADLWDFERLAPCAACGPARKERLHQMNLRQITSPPVRCPVCAA